MYRLIVSLIASLICVVCFSQVNDSIKLGQLGQFCDVRLKKLIKSLQMVDFKLNLS